MTRTKLTTFGLLALMAGASIAPAMANDQSDKNNSRNLAIGGAAVAAFGLFSHNNTVTLLGAAGAALAGSQYEKDRQDQSQDHGRYYHYNRDGDNGYDRNGYNHDGYNRDGFNHDGFNRDGYNRDGFNRDGYNHDGFSRDGFNREGYNRGGFDRHGDNRDGFNQNRDNQNRDNQNRDGRNYDQNNRDQNNRDRNGDNNGDRN